jgi:hypothetical protein
MGHLQIQFHDAFALLVVDQQLRSGAFRLALRVGDRRAQTRESLVSRLPFLLQDEVRSFAIDMEQEGHSRE